MEVTVDFSKIMDWDTFHSVFGKKMGFPDFYSKNMNAWIDCMSYVFSIEYDTFGATSAFRK